MIFEEQIYFLNSRYNTIYYFYIFKLFLMDFKFLPAQSQYNLVNRHIFASAASKFSHITVSFLKLSRIDDILIKSICDNTVLLSGLSVLIVSQQKLN